MIVKPASATSYLTEHMMRLIDESGLLPDGALIARIGGDEFACVAPFDPARGERIDRLASAIIDAVAQPVTINGVTIEATVSIGVTRSDIRCASAGERNTGPVCADSLLHMADIAMYHAKKRGRNRYFWFEARLDDMIKSAGYRIGPDEITVYKAMGHAVEDLARGSGATEVATVSPVDRTSRYGGVSGTPPQPSSRRSTRST